MAMTEMNYMSGGGSETSTPLWTNSTTSGDFSDTTVTLSDSVANYRYIAFKFKYNKSASDSSDSVEIRITSDDLIKCSGNSVDNTTKVTLAARGVSMLWIRIATLESNTTIRIRDCWRINATGTDNSYVTPISISGIN